MTPLLETAGWTLIHFVWQGCAIAAIVAAALHLVERRSANVRYAIACAGLVALLAAPAATFRVLALDATASGATTAPGRAPSPSGPRTMNEALRGTRAMALGAGRLRADASRHRRSAGAALARVPARASLWLDRAAPSITIIWLAGVALLLARMAGGWWRVGRLHRRALASAASPWQAACRRLAHRLGLAAAAHVVESNLVDVPTVVGWLRPAILLPVSAIAALSPAQVEAILAHELAHIRRHDYAVNLVQTLAETLLFYHPAVWWMSARIRTEREHCCDAIAVQVCGDPVGYARALAELETLRTARTTLAMAATGGSLLDRVTRILRSPVDDEPRSPNWMATLVLTVIFVAGAGGVQRLPWLVSRTDARAASAAEPQVAPPAASAPPAQRDLAIHVAWSDSTSRFDVTLRGDVTFTDDLTDVESLSPGGYLKIRDWSQIIPRTIEIQSAGGSLTRTYYVGGVPRGWDAEARQWLASQLPALVRRSGLGADSRVKSILQKKGVTGVIAEVALLGGDYARRLYLVALVDQARLDRDAILQVLQRVERMSSAYEQRRVLTHVASNVRLDVPTSAAYARAASSITSAYEQRQALTALMKSDVTALDSDAVVAAVAHIKSSYEKRVALTEAIDVLTLTPGAKRSLLTAAATIEADHERALVLSAYAGKFGPEPATSDAFFAALDSMHSDYERRGVLIKVAKRGPLSPEALQGAIGVVAAMSSDHERAEVLLALLQTQRGVTGGNRQAFVSAAERIGSSYDQNRVLAALVKSEAR